MRFTVWLVALIAAIAEVSSPQAISKLQAQEKLPQSLAILPTIGSSLTSEGGWRASQYLADYIQKNYHFLQLDEQVIRIYLQSHQIAQDTLSNNLWTIARALHVDLLLQPKIEEKEGNRIYKLYLFETGQNKITKISAQQCECQESNSFSFPFQKATKLLFETPDILLTIDSAREEPLPPPIILPEKPKAPAKPAEKQKPAEKDSLVAQSSPAFPPKRSGFSWRRYAAGAVLVSGSVLYLVTRKKSTLDHGATRLPDPPNPPGSN